MFTKTQFTNLKIFVREKSTYNISQKTAKCLKQEFLNKLHKARIIQEVINDCVFEELHPPYSPDLFLNDYYFFPKLKNLLKERRFLLLDDLITTVESYFIELPKKFFSRA